MDGFGEEKDVSESDQEKLDALKVPIPIQEHERLAIIRQCNLLDTPNDETFDRYVSLAHRYFKVPIVLISLIDVDRQWFKSRIGLAAAETSRDVAFCAYTILDDTPRVMVVPDSFLDNRFKNNPLVRGPPYIRFYAGASIIVKGLKVATLCLIDNILHETLSREHEKILVGC
jgi:GAF domain-containing protein